MFEVLRCDLPSRGMRHYPYSHLKRDHAPVAVAGSEGMANSEPTRRPFEGHE